MRKICVVVTARPSYSRIKTALAAIQDHPELELQLVVAGSALLDRYGSAVDYIESDGFEITARVFNVLEGEDLSAAAKTTGIAVLELSSVFDNIQPDAVVSIADRFETLATAVAASYMNIPLIHVQGGEVSGNIDEKVRHAVTKLADMHFVASERARDRVIRLGEIPERVYNTGCPSIDLAARSFEHERLSKAELDFYGGVGGGVDPSEDYLVVLQHPVTTEYEQARIQIAETLHAVQQLGLPTCWFWPNVDAGSDGTSRGIRTFREQKQLSHVRFFKNLDSRDFLRLIRFSTCLIGNSSAGIREGAFLGVPVVNIGSRQSGRDRGHNVKDVGYDRIAILEAVNFWIEHGKPPRSSTYGGGNAGSAMADILASAPLTHNKMITY